MERTRHPAAPPPSTPSSTSPSRPASPAQRRLASLRDPAQASQAAQAQSAQGRGYVQPETRATARIPDPPREPLPGVPLSEAITAHHPHRQPLWMTSFADRVPMTLRGRWLLDTRAALALGCVSLVGAGLGGWYLWQSQPTVVDLPGQTGMAGRSVEQVTNVSSDGTKPDLRPQTIVLPDVAADPGSATRPGATSGANPGADSGGGPGTNPEARPAGAIIVDVEGKVPRPGIQALPPGSRVYDALRAAGGAPAGLDLTSLDLARPLADGEQIRIGLAGAPAAMTPAESGTTSSAPGPRTKRGRPTQPVDLNTATAEQLETIPDIGPAMAQRILDWRTQHGSFASIGQLREVRGIGERKFADIKDSVRV